VTLTTAAVNQKNSLRRDTASAMRTSLLAVSGNVRILTRAVRMIESHSFTLGPMFGIAADNITVR
jgi:hypothetical protein